MGVGRDDLERIWLFLPVDPVRDRPFPCFLKRFEADVVLGVTAVLVLAVIVDFVIRLIFN